MELMIVVILVAILAALALPSLTRSRLDRLPAAGATRLSLLVRSARARAIDRGAAILVHVSTSAATNRGTFSAWEAVSPNPSGTGANRLPFAACRGAHWSNNLSQVTAPDLTTNAGFGMNRIDFLKLGGGVEDDADLRTLIDGNNNTATCICFSPSGRSYVDACGQPATGNDFAPSAAPLFTALTAYQCSVVTVQRGVTAIGLRRNVIIPPSGATRVVTGL
jgi:Tfp pilus assembly protein FimT